MQDSTRTGGSVLTGGADLAQAAREELAAKAREPG
jgi:hypothetical protein